MAIKIGNQITLDGQFADWLATDALMTSANTVAGYQVYGAFLSDATLGNTYVIGIDATATTDAAIAAGTVIYLNTDRNNATGFSPFGKVGAEYEVQFALDSIRSPSALSVFGHIRRRHHPAQRRGATRCRLLQQRRECRTRDPAGVADAGRGRRTHLDQFCHPGQWRTGSAWRFLHQSGIHHHRPRGGCSDNDRQPDHARWDLRGLAGGRHRHKSGKRRRGLSNRRRIPQRCDARQHLRDRYRRDRRDGPGHRPGRYALFEYGSKRRNRL